MDIVLCFHAQHNNSNDAAARLRFWTLFCFLSLRKWFWQLQRKRNYAYTLRRCSRSALLCICPVKYWWHRVWGKPIALIWSVNSDSKHRQLKKYSLKWDFKKAAVPLGILCFNTWNIHKCICSGVRFTQTSVELLVTFNHLWLGDNSKLCFSLVWMQQVYWLMGSVEPTAPVKKN